MTTEETRQDEEAGRRVTDEPDEEDSMDVGGESARDSLGTDPFASPVSSSLSTVSARLRFELSLLAIPDRREVIAGTLGAAVVVAALATLAGGLDVTVPLPLTLGLLGVTIAGAWWVVRSYRLTRLEQMSELVGDAKRIESGERTGRDPLTGAYNRTLLEERWLGFVTKTRRQETELSILILDIDELEKLNTEHGETAGDHALQDLAEILNRSSRGSDIVARYEEDEFIVLLSETGAEGAEVVLGRVLERVHARNQEVADRAAPFTASAGHALFESDTSLDTFIRAAKVDMMGREKVS